MSRLSTIIATWLLLAAASLCPAEPAPRFTAARSIWPEGREKEMNLQVGFRAIVDVSPDAERIVLRLTASCVYRASVNGEFLGHGPARGPHGHYRVDEWDMSGHARPGANVIAIEVAGYNLDGFYLLNQPSFLQAEVVQDGKVLAATGPRPVSTTPSSLTCRRRRRIRGSGRSCASSSVPNAARPTTCRRSTRPTRSSAASYPRTRVAGRDGNPTSSLCAGRLSH